MTPIILPKLIDTPPQIALWEMDDILPIVLLIGIGALVKHLIPCMIVGFILANIYAKFKLKTSRGAILYWAHWYGLTSIGRIKNGLSRVYTGW